MIARILLSVISAVFLAALATSFAQIMPVGSFPQGAGGCSTFTDVWSTTYPTPGFWNNTGTTSVDSTTGGTQAEIGVRCHNGGKWYFRLSASHYGNDNLGIATADQKVTVRIGDTQTSPSCQFGSGVSCGVSYVGNQSPFTTNSWRLDAHTTNITSLTNVHANDIIGFIVDLTGGYICLKDETTGDGWWGNNAVCDPANISANGFSIPNLAGATVYRAISVNNQIATFTMYNGAGTPPSGYAQW